MGYEKDQTGETQIIDGHDSGVILRVKDFALRLHRKAPPYDIVIITALFFIINARWILKYRHSLLLDIDEAGYLSYSLLDYFGLIHHGVIGWISAIETPSIQAPLTMALSSLLYYVFGPHLIVGFFVPLLAATAAVAATYALGRSVGSRYVAVTAAVLTASCPIIINYARSYQFSTLATLFATLALVAILRSRGFRSLGWTLIFGLSLGLMILSRTMTIAFIPGLVAAAGVAAVSGSSERAKRISRLCFAGVLGGAVAAIWYWRNGALVAHYLLNFGYGAHAVEYAHLEYGHRSSKFGIDAWMAMSRALINDVYAPHFLIILFAFAILFVVVSRAVAKAGLGMTARRIYNSSLLPLIIFVAEAAVVLTSTSNKGSGFLAPLAPALMVITAAAFEQIRNSRLGRASTSALVTAIVVVAIVPLADLHTPFAGEWRANLPLIGAATVTRGRGNLQSYEVRWGYGLDNAVEPLDVATSRAWVELSSWTAVMLSQEIGPQAGVAFAFRNALYNVNTVNLQQLLRVRSAFRVLQVDPTMTGESVDGYLQWLTKDGADVCALLTSDRPGGDFAPVINRGFMEEAARRAGFVSIRHWAAPDGQIISLWRHQSAPPSCRSAAN